MYTENNNKKPPTLSLLLQHPRNYKAQNQHTQTTYQHLQQPRSLAQGLQLVHNVNIGLGLPGVSVEIRRKLAG